MRDYFHELYGDDPFDDERRVVPDGGSVRAPVTFHLADGKDAERCSCQEGRSEWWRDRRMLRNSLGCSPRLELSAHYSSLNPLRFT